MMLHSKTLLLGLRMRRDDKALMLSKGRRRSGGLENPLLLLQRRRVAIVPRLLVSAAGRKGIFGVSVQRRRRMLRILQGLLFLKMRNFLFDSFSMLRSRRSVEIFKLA